MSNMCIRNLLIESLLQHGEKIAISFFRKGKPETEITYNELNSDSNRIANFFFSKGVKKGDRVILFLPKSVLFVVIHLALQKLGAVAVPINPDFRHEEMIYLIKNSEPSLVVAGKIQADIVGEIDSTINIFICDNEAPYQSLNFFRSSSEVLPDTEIQAEEASLIIYTSGTTGKPKGAVLTQYNLGHDALNIIRIWRINEADVLCHALPLFHVHGLCFALHTALVAGAGVIFLDRFTPEETIERLVRKNGSLTCAVFMAVPSMYVKMMDYIGERKLDFGHMRLWASGSAPLLSRDFERIHRVFGMEPVEREGMSETGMNFSNPLEGRKIPGSIGFPLPKLQVRIVDPDSLKNLKKGEIGEIWLKGPGITPGYWRKPEDTRRVFENGWFRTGDLGKVDENGYYFLTDRIKNIIISGGENISPKEVETIINQLDQVVESAVVGIPDETWGEKVVAAVTLKPGSNLSKEDIREYCKSRIHRWKTPKQIVFIKDIPKNKMGKVLRNKVKDFF